VVISHGKGGFNSLENSFDKWGGDHKKNRTKGKKSVQMKLPDSKGCKT